MSKKQIPELFHVLREKLNESAGSETGAKTKLRYDTFDKELCKVKHGVIDAITGNQFVEVKASKP